MHHWACFTPRLAREERGEARERDSKRETEKKTARQWKREKDEEERMFCLTKERVISSEK